MMTKWKDYAEAVPLQLLSKGLTVRNRGNCYSNKGAQLPSGLGHPKACPQARAIFKNNLIIASNATVVSS